MALWYYSNGEDRQGPVGAAEIDRLVADGAITADTLVWRDGLAGWEAASAHFPATTAPASSAAPPSPPAPTPVPDAPEPARVSPHTPASPGAHDPLIGPDGLYLHAPSRTFGEAISTCFSKYLTFSGRASRSEYWFFVLFLFLLGMVASILDVVLVPGSLEAGGPVNAVVSLVTFLPAMAVTWRRLHDINRSGWWIGGMYLALVVLFGVAAALFGAGSGLEPDGAIALIPLLGIGFFIYAIVLLVFFCTKGTLGPNRFG